MSSASPLDQLCAAACDNTGMAAAAGPAMAEIKVVEVDAYASVADLIHASILANTGAASLKEIYEVCEGNGRIAYRRAGGSRLITSNDHWKSQVRHALYTGGRFQRVTHTSEYWQLVPAHAGAAAELLKVLVRADDPTRGVVASASLPPSSGRARAAAPAAPAARPAAAPSSRHSNRPSRKRGKRSGADSDEEEEEGAGARAGEGSAADAFCDSVDPAAVGSRMRSPRAPGLNADPSDDHSTQEWEDKLRELPRLRATRASGRHSQPPPPRPTPPFGTPAPTAMPPPLSRTVGQRGSRNVSLGASEEDPSTLRWGHTALRSTFIIAADSGGSLSAGRPPAAAVREVGGAVPRARAPSAEADSPAHFPWFGGLPAAAGGVESRRQGGGPPAKRRATHPVPQLPNASVAGSDAAAAAAVAAAAAAPMMAQWGEAMQQLQAMMAGPAPHQAGAKPWPQGAVMPPMAMLPYLLAGAPFVNGQAALQQMQAQMQAVMLGAAAQGGAGAQQRQSTRAAAKGAAQDKTRRS